MNDRIAQLLTRAEQYVDTFYHSELWSEYDRQHAINQEFAELIIRECAKVAFLGSALPIEDSEKVRDIIIEHFGIE